MYEEQIGHIPDGAEINTNDLIQDIVNEADEANIELNTEDGTIELKDGDKVIGKIKVSPSVIKVGLSIIIVAAVIAKVLGLW